MPRTSMLSGRRWFLPAAVVLGIGLGGFFDGIVLHQVLQWHHMVSSTTPPVTLADLELNTTADGLFHALTWIVTVVGVLMLLTAERPASQPLARFIAGLLIGWGLFNLVEGLINHHLLGLHHVRPGPDEALYDVGFLIWGAAVLAAGGGLWRRAAAQERTTASAVYGVEQRPGQPSTR
jgi:uncharacterized membrane protein